MQILYQARLELALTTFASKRDDNMEIKKKGSDFVDIRLSSDEYKAFVELMKLQKGVKDYKKGGK